MSEPGDQLAELISAWLAMQVEGSTRALAALLDEGVLWQGVLPDQRCENRAEVLALFGRNLPRPPRVTELRAEEWGTRVVLCVSGPDFPADEAHAPAAPRCLVFSFSDDRVVRIDSVATYEAAVALARG